MRTLKPVVLDVNEAVIAAYAELTNDYNPLHVDAEFAANSAFGGIIAHGTMSLNLIWQSLTTTLGAGAAEGARLDIRFIKPVRIGDTITAGGKSDDGITWAVSSRTRDGVAVIDGTLTLAGTGA